MNSKHPEDIHGHLQGAKVCFFTIRIFAKIFQVFPNISESKKILFRIRGKPCTKGWQGHHTVGHFHCALSGHRRLPRTEMRVGAGAMGLARCKGGAGVHEICGFQKGESERDMYAEVSQEKDYPLGELSTIYVGVRVPPSSSAGPRPTPSHPSLKLAGKWEGVVVWLVSALTRYGGRQQSGRL